METRNGDSEVSLEDRFQLSLEKFRPSDFGPDFLFLFLNGAQPFGGFFKPGRPLPPEIREEIVDLYNAGYSMNEISRTTLVTRRSVLLSSARILGILLSHQ